MISGGRLIGVVAAFSVGITLCAAHAEALPATTSGVRSATLLPAQKTPPPKPKASLKLIKSGARVDLTEKQTGRQEKRPTAPTKKVSKSTEDSLIRPQEKNKRVTPFRLNLGICGRVGPDGTIPGPTRCQPFTPERPDEPDRPGGVIRQLPRPEDVTWERILAEYKDVLFPGLGVKVQPVGKTLVNLETIVYTDESAVSEHTVQLLGFPVVVQATPVSYTWEFGDGESVTTTSPGKAYPAKEITHKYMKRGDVRITLTTNYAARYDVAGTGWQYVDGTVPITGPATALLVREAVPVLVDPNR